MLLLLNLLNDCPSYLLELQGMLNGQSIFLSFLYLIESLLSYHFVSVTSFYPLPYPFFFFCHSMPFYFIFFALPGWWGVCEEYWTWLLNQLLNCSIRAANVFSCAYLVNLVRPAHRQIPLKHQKALWYSGKLTSSWRFFSFWIINKAGGCLSCFFWNVADIHE